MSFNGLCRYNLTADRAETTDLWESQRPLAKAMLRRFQAWQATVFASQQQHEIGCADPMPTAVSRSVHLKDASNLDLSAVEKANKNWWKTLWSSSSVSIPGEPWLEQLYYGQTYLIASATRAGKTPPGLYGPWVHTDSPYCEGDLTINYNYEATFFSLYSNNRIELTWAHYEPLTGSGFRCDTLTRMHCTA